MNAQEILARLALEHCIHPNGSIGIYPQWLTIVELNRLTAAGLIIQEHGNPNNYNHTIDRLTPAGLEAIGTQEPEPEFPQVWTPDGMQHTFTAPDEPIQPNLF